MRITVIAKPGSKHAKVIKTDDARYEISVVAVPEKGKATDAVRRALATELGIAPSRLSLVMGGASRTKVFEVR
jgi:uncharacterized protein YggU (UPF0235/DUF167 family)